MTIATYITPRELGLYLAFVSLAINAVQFALWGFTWLRRWRTLRNPLIHVRHDGIEVCGEFFAKPSPNHYPRIKNWEFGHRWLGGYYAIERGTVEWVADTARVRGVCPNCGANYFPLALHHEGARCVLCSTPDVPDGYALTFAERNASPRWEQTAIDRIREAGA